MTLCCCAVRFVQADALKQQLELGHVVLLNSLAYSAAGEVLNCNSYDVATHAAIELAADKFICVLDGVDDLNLPQWLPLGDAEDLIASRAQVRTCRRRPRPAGFVSLWPGNHHCT